MIAVWALFVSPKPAIKLTRPLRLTIELCVWAAAAVALAASGHRNLGVTFGVVAVISGGLNYIWD